MRNDTILKNMTISGLCKPLSMFVGYIYIPVLLNYFGDLKYGVWVTIMSIVSWISYFDIGIGNGLRNRLTEAIAKGDAESCKRMVSSAYFIMIFIVLFIIVFFWFIAFFLNWNTILGANILDENLYIVICLNVTFVSINFIISLCNNILFAIQKASIVGVLNLIIQLVNLVGIFIAKHYYHNSLLLITIIYGCSMIFVNLVYSFILFHEYKYLSPTLSKAAIETGKSLFKLGMDFFIIQISALVLFTTDNLIISFLFGAEDVTPYSMVVKLFMAIFGVYNAFLVPIWSATTEAKVKLNFAWVNAVIRKLKLLMIPFFIVSFILCFGFQTISNIWLGKELLYEKGLIFLGCIYCLLNIWCSTFAQIANGLELMEVSVKVALLQAVVNIPLSLLFSIYLNLGPTGVLLGTVLSMSVAAFVLPKYINSFIQKCVVSNG